jgi:hypothetical protein
MTAPFDVASGSRSLRMAAVGAALVFGPVVFALALAVLAGSMGGQSAPPQSVPACPAEETAPAPATATNAPSPTGPSDATGVVHGECAPAIGSTETPSQASDGP